MYTLYHVPGASSLAIHVLLNELKQEFKLVLRPDEAEYKLINPTGKVPLLIDGHHVLAEGAAISLYLMEKHNSALIPNEFNARTKSIQWMMFANSSVYTAYVKLFLVKSLKIEEKSYQQVVDALNQFWKVADTQLGKTKYLGGDTIGMGDIFLTVYSGWNKHFEGKIILGKNALRMVHEISERDSFKKAVAAEKIDFKI